MRRNEYDALHNDTLVQRIRFTCEVRITKPFVCVTSKGSIYKHNNPLRVVEHAFSRTEFVCEPVHAANTSSGGILSTARPELPYPCISEAKSRNETSRGDSYVTCIIIMLV